jgi:phenol 2-monooxygenase (NADPH)
VTVCSADRTGFQTPSPAYLGFRKVTLLPTYAWTLLSELLFDILQQVVLHQGRIERFFLDNIKKYSNNAVQVERGVLPESLEIEESKIQDSQAHPVTIKLRHLSEEESTPEQQATGSKVNDGLFRSNLTNLDDEDDLICKSQARSGKSEIVHAKYVIGCDGARSWTRRMLGFELQGDTTDFIWGVMDIIPITDFRKSNRQVNVVEIK